MVLEYCGGGKYRLVKPMKIMGYEVPAGFVTDGASIPRIFWSVVGSPFTGKYVEVAVLHDYLYSGAEDVSFKEANRIFYKGMRKAGVNRAKAYLMYKAVSLFGKKRFRRD
ncbi:DUF1353 domain-containing protein [Hydrogenimonas thermophila]|uniref:DUF1353 domain-containing protein n=1 Tax=Hydrogenimonas thermophila TaxID=223786 RepID=A0A1I5RP02_9BACT|nr:DUF1353 domain-containing protein [Hydrogenimonas thermophila]SFP60235.1 Protein of unknown function [Hydrogenimonas thermophila]